MALVLQLVLMCLIATFLPFIILVVVSCSIIRFCLGLWVSLSGQYGKLLNPTAAGLDTDFSSGKSKFYLVSTLQLEGDLSVEELRTIFRETVLNATVRVGKEERLRYPEFRQYIVSILGFPVWKNEENFDITEHIQELTSEGKFLDMGELHGNLLNRIMPVDRSPWEMVLIRNTIPVDGTDPNEFQTYEEKTILAFKMHHVMGDFKSVMKVLVECMGKKKLSVPEAREEEMGVMRRFLYPILFPLYLIWETGKGMSLTLRHRSHPFYVGWDDDSKLIVKFSKSLEISSLKSAAAQNGVTLSAVLISVIAGALKEHFKNTDGGCSDDKMGLIYILPKGNHPNVLINHWRGGFNIFPTNYDSTSELLHRFESIFQSMKRPEHCAPVEMTGRMLGLLPRSRLKRILCRVYLSSIGITNLAGDREGFSIGGIPCSDFSFSVGLPLGCTGVIFSLLGYKGHIRVAVCGRESVLPEKSVANLTNLINEQYEELRRPKAI